MSGSREVDDGGVNGAHLVERIFFELIHQFRSVNRPLRFYEVESKLLDGLKKLRLPAEKLEKEMGLLRGRLESLGAEKGAIEIELRKMRDCVELTGVFSRLEWSGGVDSTVRSAEEIYETMLSKLMSGNREDLSDVVDHLRKKVEELERGSWDVGVLRRKMERLEGENAELSKKGDRGSREVGEMKRKVKELQVENVDLRRKGEESSRDVVEMKRKMEELEFENMTLRRKVEGDSRDAKELRKVKEDLALADAKLKVKEELTMASAKLKVKAEGNSRDLIELSRKLVVLEAENKALKTDLERNVARLKRRTEDTELQNASLTRELDETEKICEDLKTEKGALERKNEMMKRDLNKLAQENKKLEKKISWWKKNYEELDKRVITLEKDVIELKSCGGEGMAGHEDGREGHCNDEKLDSRSKNGKTCNAGNGVGNGKLGEVIGTVLSAEKRNGVHSSAIPTGNTTPISGELVELMDSDDDTTLAGCLSKNKHSQKSWDDEPPSSSMRELKRKRDTFIDLTDIEDNNKNSDDFCRSSSWMDNNKRSDLGLSENLDRSYRNTGSSSVPPSRCSQVRRYNPDFGEDDI